MARRISVTAKTSARQSRVDKLSESEYRVSVQAPAQDGKANQALIELLARYFDIPKTMFRIIRGRSSRQKLIEIDK
jgi:uncharacterized protein (TIGR00251 family)